MSKSKPSPTQLRALALLAREGATLEGWGFRETYYRITTPGDWSGERITSPTRAAILPYVEPVSDKPFEKTYRLNDLGRLALVGQTLGKPARDALALAQDRAKALGRLIEALARATGAARRLVELYSGPGNTATTLADMAGGYIDDQERAAALLRTVRYELATALEAAMRANGVEPLKRETEEAPAPQYT
jgi:hypothetical protein